MIATRRHRPIPQRTALIGIFALASGLGFAQEPGPAPTPAPAPAPAPAPVLKAPQPANLEEAKRMVVETYAKIAEANCADALSQAIELRKDIQDFVVKPGVPNHIGAKLGWVQARLPYLQSEVFQLAGAPAQLAAGVNPWPLDESYIDAVDGDVTAGIINDADGHPVLSPEALAKLNGVGGESNVATGYHAIEFLLWGQDLDPDGRGKRTHTDYLADAAPNAERRAAYLSACGDLLVRQLSDLLALWAAGKPDNYRAKFEKLPVDQALAHVLGSVATMAREEMAAFRIGAPYRSKDQEDEQSDFSDTTHMDALHNTAGIANVVAGAYVGLDGKVKVLGVGLVGLADMVSEERGQKMRAAINAALTAARKIESPFDREILGEDTAPGRVRVKALIDALNGLADEVTALGEELGVN